jgi:hypothetical protein
MRLMGRTTGEVVPMRRPLTLCFAAALAVCGVVFGQGMTGSIRVIVRAPDGSVVPGATVTAEAPDALGARTAVSDQRGMATFAGIQPSAAYLVTVTLDQFEPVHFENVLVRAGQTSTLRAVLKVVPIQAEILVIGESPTIDFSSTITGQDITLELTESLPTGRTYQNYLQLVPGVMPTDPTDLDENPAARSGMNYTDGGGNIGRSRDNFYYIEGIDVTDPYRGTFGANLNTEIIQEQSVMTGGIPAEYVGRRVWCQTWSRNAVETRITVR